VPVSDPVVDVDSAGSPASSLHAPAAMVTASAANPTNAPVRVL